MWVRIRRRISQLLDKNVVARSGDLVIWADCGVIVQPHQVIAASPRPFINISVRERLTGLEGTRARTV